MNEAKAEKQQQSSEELEEQHSTIDKNKSDLLPAPMDNVLVMIGVRMTKIMKKRRMFQ